MLITNELFTFNLLPRATEEEIELIEERDNSLFYAVGVVLFSSIVWFVTAIFLAAVMIPLLSANQQALAEVKGKVSSYSFVKSRHGELVYKADLLKPLLERKIETDLIFLVGDELISDVDPANLISYEREQGGKFVFRIITAGYEAVEDIMDNAYLSLDNQVDNVELRSASYDQSTNLVITTLALEINGVTSDT